MNIEQARINMLTQQIRTWEVLDETVLALFKQIPREQFVPVDYQTFAFADVAIPMSHGRTMMPPKEEARIIQALQVKPQDKVLVLGTGSGYLTALLAKQSRWVYSVDSEVEFNQRAELRLAKLNIANVTFINTNVFQGWNKAAPYDVIVLTGSLPKLPEHLRQLLAVHGKLFVILGQKPVMEATLFTQTTQNQWHTTKLFETNRERLPDFVEQPLFTF